MDRVRRQPSHCQRPVGLQAIGWQQFVPSLATIRHGVWCLAVVAVALCIVGWTPVHGETVKSSTASTQDLIVLLDSDSYDERKQATEQLIAAGADAAIPLVTALQQGSREVMMRAIHVLDQQARSDDPVVEQAARAALTRTIQVGSKSAVSLAESALASVNSWRQSNALSDLVELGAKTSEMVMLQANLQGNFFPARIANHQLYIGDDWHGQPDDLERLRWITDLEQIHFTGKRIADEEMKFLVSAPNLQTVVLHATSVTDAGLAQLSKMRRLNFVDIRYLTISDAGVENIASIENLYELRLKGTKISQQGMKRLQTRVGENNFVFHGGAMLGVQTNATILEANGCPVQNVTAGSAAEASGLRGGDLITAIDDDTIDSFDTLKTLMAKRGGGEKITIKYQRNGEMHSTVATLGEWPMETEIEPRVEGAVPGQAIPQIQVVPAIQIPPQNAPPKK